VDDLRDGQYLSIANGELFAQCFKCSIVTAMAKAACLEHVERNCCRSVLAPANSPTRASLPVVVMQ